MKILYSFPHKIGASRICYIAWQQVQSLVAAGADVTVWPGSVQRPVDADTFPTLARGKWRIPYKLLGTTRACALHDYIVARRIEKLGWMYRGKFDVIHTWPLGARRTLAAAKKLSIPTVLERCNAHTRYAFEAVQRECDWIGVALPPDHEHAYKADVLAIEEEEYTLADRLLCPSEFVKKTFLDQGFPEAKLSRYIYGFDEKTYYPEPKQKDRPFTALFAGVCAVRKGLHFALEAWLASPASQDGIFQIAGEFLPAYRRKLDSLLSHPSVRVLGHRNDLPQLMRQSDVMMLPSIEEGFGLVCTEAMGSGCVPLVSEACTDICQHMENSLVHRIGDVPKLTYQLSFLHEDRSLLKQLREGGLQNRPNMTWDAAAQMLLGAYEEAIRNDN